MDKIPSLSNMFYQTQVLKNFADLNKGESQTMNNTMKKFNNSKLGGVDVNFRTGSQENIVVMKQASHNKQVR